MRLAVRCPPHPRLRTRHSAVFYLLPLRSTPRSGSHARVPGTPCSRGQQRSGEAGCPAVGEAAHSCAAGPVWSDDVGRSRECLCVVTYAVTVHGGAANRM